MFLKAIKIIEVRTGNGGDTQFYIIFCVWRLVWEKCIMYGADLRLNGIK